MCLNCGCMDPKDDHGDSSNITLDDMQKAAKANDQDLDEAFDNMERTYHQAVVGQDVTQSRHEHSF